MVVVVLTSNASGGVDQTAKPISERGKRKEAYLLLFG